MEAGGEEDVAAAEVELGTEVVSIQEVLNCLLEAGCCYKLI